MPRGSARAKRLLSLHRAVRAALPAEGGAQARPPAPALSSGGASPGAWSRSRAADQASGGTGRHRALPPRAPRSASPSPAPPPPGPAPSRAAPRPPAAAARPRQPPPRRGRPRQSAGGGGRGAGGARTAPGGEVPLRAPSAAQPLGSSRGSGVAPAFHSAGCAPARLAAGISSISLLVKRFFFCIFVCSDKCGALGIILLCF